MVKVHTPVLGVNKIIAGIPFSNGTGEVDPKNISALRYFQRHGYKIDSGKAKQTGEGTEVLNSNLAPDGTGGGVGLAELSVPELRSYAKAHNINVKGHQSKVGIRNAIEVALTADRPNLDEVPVTSQAGDPKKAPEQPKQAEDGDAV